MWQGWLMLVFVAVAVAGCASDGIHASGSRDDGRMPAWRRVAPDLLQPPPRYPAPEDSGRA